jgi:hypothetical protein
MATAATPAAKPAPPQADRRLELARVLADLVADGLVPKEAADALVPTAATRAVTCIPWW